MPLFDSEFLKKIEYLSIVSRRARRFIAEGRTVKIARPPKGMDFNDLLQVPPGVAVISDQRRRANG